MIAVMSRPRTTDCVQALSIPGEGSGAMAPHFMSFIFFGVHRALGVRPAVEAAFATEVGTQEDLLNRLLAPNAVRQGA